MLGQSRIGIVIVHYNSYAETLDCLRSLEGLSKKNFFVVLVDNASTDGSGWRLQEEMRAVRSWYCIHNPENTGFAAGANIGIAYARANGASFVWLLNPDTTVEAEALEQLLDSAQQHPEVFAFGSKVVFAGSSENRIWSAGGAFDNETQEVRMIGHGELDGVDFSTERECDYLPGCSLFFRVDGLQAVGMLPEEYFLYFEETQWCAYARSLGKRLLYVPRSVVYHLSSPEKMQQPLRIYYYNRNRRLFWYRRADFFGRWRILSATLRDAFRAQRALGAASEATDCEVFRAHRASCLDFLLGRSGRSENWTSV